MHVPEPTHRLKSIMCEAYNPCHSFGVCREARWDPAAGHLPRGFIGATGRPEDVEVVMVFAQPGHPYAGEGFDPDLTPEKLMKSALAQTYHSFKTSRDAFHGNARWFMNQLYPDLTFDEQLRHVWLTEGRLCSFDVEIGGPRDRTCARHYLTRQIDALPNATIVAFGGKAKHYLGGLGIDFVGAYSLAPPGANHRPALPSWEAAINKIVSRRPRTAPA